MGDGIRARFGFRALDSSRVCWWRDSKVVESVLPATSENPAYVRPCTDASEYKALGFFVVEHFLFNSILAISPQSEIERLAPRSSKNKYKKLYDPYHIISNFRAYDRAVCHFSNRLGAEWRP